MALSLRAFVDVHDFVLTHLHHIAIVQVMAPHAPGLNVDAIGAVQVFDQAGIHLRHDLAVMTADEFTVDLQIVVRRSSDHQATWAQFALEDGLALAGQ
jgi:hypothetical protein